MALDRLEKAGLRLNRGKCVFMTDSVAYPRHIVDAQDLHDPDKARVVEEDPQPRCTSELKSLLGLFAYYSKFLPDLATVLRLSMPYSAETHPGRRARRGRKPSK